MAQRIEGEAMKWTVQSELRLLVSILHTSKDPKLSLEERACWIIGVQIPATEIARKSEELRRRYEKMRGNYTQSVDDQEDVSTVYFKISNMIWGK